MSSCKEQLKSYPFLCARDMLGRPGSCAATHHFGERLANIDRQEQSKTLYHAFDPGLRHRLIPLSQYVRGVDISVADAIDLPLSRVVEQDPGTVVGLGREPKSAGQEAAQGRQTATPTKAREVSKVTRGIFFSSGLLTDLASSQLSGQTRWPFRHTIQVTVQKPGLVLLDINGHLPMFRRCRHGNP